jgi:hypothetical protein
MAGKSDFTEAEWETLRKGVTGAGMFVSAGHRDFTDSFGEASALAKELVAQRKEGATPLLRELAEGHSTEFGFFTSPAELEEGTLTALREAVGILSSKAPDELEPYRALVLDVAETVAEAKGGVRPEETAVIEKVRDAVGGAGGAG